MSRLTPKELINSLNRQFSVEVSICEIYQQRWSHVVSSFNFVYANHRLILSDSFGLMLNCDNKTLQKIQDFLEEIEVIA